MSNIFLFYGEEKYLIKELNEKLINENLNSDYRDFNLVKIDGSKFDFNLANENLETLPFFDDKKIVVLDDLNLSKNGVSSNGKELELFVDYLDKVPKSSILIINSYIGKVFKGKFYKKIEKVGNIENAGKLEYNDLYNYIENYFLENKIEISKKVIDYIIDKSAYFNKELNKNLYDLNNELHKLTKDKNNSKIKTEDIEKLFTNSFETNIFKLTDAVSSRNIKQSHRVYLDLMKNSGDSFQIFYMMVRTIRNILIVKESVRLNYTNNQINKKYSISNYEINKLKQVIKYWRYDDLKKALHLSYKTEVELKSSSVKPKYQVENYILNILQ